MCREGSWGWWTKSGRLEWFPAYVNPRKGLLLSWEIAAAFLGSVSPPAASAHMSGPRAPLRIAVPEPEGFYWHQPEDTLGLCFTFSLLSKWLILSLMNYEDLALSLGSPHVRYLQAFLCSECLCTPTAIASFDINQTGGPFDHSHQWFPTFFTSWPT